MMMDQVVSAKPMGASMDVAAPKPVSMAPSPASPMITAPMAKPMPQPTAAPVQAITAPKPVSNIVGPSINPSPLRNVDSGMRSMAPQGSTIASMPRPQPVQADSMAASPVRAAPSPVQAMPVQSPSSPVSRASRIRPTRIGFGSKPYVQ